MKEPGKSMVTVRNNDTAKTGTQRELQTPLKLCADCHGHKTSNKLVEKKIRSHGKEFIRTINGHKKMKHKKRNAGTGVSSLKSDLNAPWVVASLKYPKSRPSGNNMLKHISTRWPNRSSPRQMHGPKRRDIFPLLQLKPLELWATNSHKTRQSPTYYCCEETSSDSLVTSLPKITKQNWWCQKFPILQYLC